jgi:hypothetical protein
MAGLLAGCSTLRYGGAPEPSFDADKDLEQLAKIFEPGASIEEFYKTPTVEARNKFVTGRVTMMNIRYIQFVRRLTTDKQLLDTAGAMLTMGLGIAGASFAAASTKTVLAALSAGVSGSREAIDKNYFFDRTIPALVGQMNAERKKAVIPLVVGTATKTLDAYPFAHAITDLHNYYFAGTFTGAIQSIQADAAVKESQADSELRTLMVEPVPAALQERREKAAEFVKSLSPAQIAELAKNLGLPPNSEVRDVLREIAAAQTQERFDRFAQQVKILFGKEF